MSAPCTPRLQPRFPRFAHASHHAPGLPRLRACSINTAPLSDVFEEHDISMPIPINRQNLTGVPFIFPGLAALLGLIGASPPSRLRAVHVHPRGVADGPRIDPLSPLPAAHSRRVLLPQDQPLAAHPNLPVRLLHVLHHSAGVLPGRHHLCVRDDRCRRVPRRTQRWVQRTPRG